MTRAHSYEVKLKVPWRAVTEIIVGHTCPLYPFHQKRLWGIARCQCSHSPHQNRHYSYPNCLMHEKHVSKNTSGELSASSSSLLFGCTAINTIKLFRWCFEQDAAWITQSNSELYRQIHRLRSCQCSDTAAHMPKSQWSFSSLSWLSTEAPCKSPLIALYILI